MKNWPLLILFFLVGCNSEMADLSSIQGIRNPNDPLPQVVDISGPPVNLYVLNDTIEFYVTFSEPVNVTGSPLLNFIADNGPLAADYVSGSGTNLLTFRKTIADGEYETSGIVLNGNLSLNGGTILSYIDLDPADLTYQSKFLSGVRINAIITEFQSIVVPDNGLYGLADNLCFTLQYNAPVSFSSGPATLPVTVGSAKAAAFVSGDGTKHLRFCYSVEAGIDVDEISVGATIDSGTLVDAFGAPVATAFTSPGILTGVDVDSLAPTITGVTSSPSDGIYYTNQSLLFDVNFSEPVSVTGNPSLSLTIGSGTKKAFVIAGNGTDTLTFEYIVQTGDLDTDGIALAGNIVYPAGSNIRDFAINSIDQAETFAVPLLGNVNVDGIEPVLLLKNIDTDNPIVRVGETISVTFVYNEQIHSTGTPKIQIDIGGTIKEAALVSATPDSGIVFAYDAEPALLDTDGITILSGIIGGTLKDGASPFAHDITFASFTSAAHKVDSFTYITSAEVISDSEIAGTPEGSYKAGKTIELRLTFSDSITVTGSPNISFNLAGSARTFTKSSETATEVHFTYTPAAGEMDLDGLDLAAAISLNGGTIKDSYGEDVQLNLPATFNPSLYLIPDSLYTWLDISDPLSANINFNSVETIRSKAEDNIPSLNGNPPYPTLVNAGGFKAANFSLSNIEYDYFASPMSQMIVVYRAPALYSAGNRLLEWGTNYYEFRSDSTIETNCADCEHFNGTSWLTPVVAGIPFIDPDYLIRYESWVPSEKKMVSIRFNTGTYNMKFSNDFTGEIAEVIIFSSTPTPIEINKIYQYLKTKHGVDF